MAQPPATYLKGKSLDRIHAYARDAKELRQKAAVNEKQREIFFRQLDRLQEGRLRDLRKKLRALYAAADKGEPSSKDAKSTKLVADGIGQIRKICQTGQKIKELKLSLQQPARSIISAPVPAGPAGVDLVLLIALLQVVEVLIRLKIGRKSADDEE